jgi:hypothetical protein
MGAPWGFGVVWAFGGLLLTRCALAQLTKGECIDADTAAQSARREGHFLDARAQLRICLNPECPEMVRSDCAQRLDELDRAQPTMLFQVRDPAGRDLGAVDLSVDGRPLLGQAEGTAIDIDPGFHAFTFRRDGWQTRTTTLVVREGDRGRHEMVVMSLALPAQLEAAHSAAPPGDHGGHTAAGGANPGRPERAFGLWVVGGGVVAAAVGAAFGFAASAAKTSYESHCGSSIGAPPGYCDPQGIRGHDQATTEATTATAFLIGGGALLATGALLLILQPRARVTWALGFSPLGALVSGEF